MSNELKFNFADIELFVSSEVSAPQRALVLKALHNAETTADVDDIGLTLSGEKVVTGFVSNTGVSSRASGEFWVTVKKEVYDYVCTTSSKYAKEREQAGAVFGQVVTVLATALAARFDVGLGVVTGIVSVALISVLKVGCNAWCILQRDTLTEP